jgi:hypothetical protein
MDDSAPENSDKSKVSNEAVRLITEVQGEFAKKAQHERSRAKKPWGPVVGITGDVGRADFYQSHAKKLDDALRLM